MVDSGILRRLLAGGQSGRADPPLEGRIHDPRKVWKLTDMDLKSYGRWNDYTEARDAMFAATDTPWAPWYVVGTDDKERGRLNLINHLLSLVPYAPLATKDVGLPEAQGRVRTRGSRSAAEAHPDTVLRAARAAGDGAVSASLGGRTKAAGPSGRRPSRGPRGGRWTITPSAATAPLLQAKAPPDLCPPAMGTTPDVRRSKRGVASLSRQAVLQGDAMPATARQRRVDWIFATPGGGSWSRPPRPSLSMGRPDDQGGGAHPRRMRGAAGGRHRVHGMGGGGIPDPQRSGVRGDGVPVGRRAFRSGTVHRAGPSATTLGALGHGWNADGTRLLRMLPKGQHRTQGPMGRRGWRPDAAGDR